MKKKLLGLALCAGIGMAQSAAAQSYDDRWYIGAGVGVGFFDADRDVSDDLYGMIGFGKMFSEHWSLDRMPVVDRALLRLGTYELGWCPGVPTAVAITEAVELAKQYSTKDSGRFVNGLLSRIAAELRPNDRPET